MQAVSMLNDIL